MLVLDDLVIKKYAIILTPFMVKYVKNSPDHRYYGRSVFKDVLSKYQEEGKACLNVLTCILHLTRVGKELEIYYSSTNVTVHTWIHVRTAFYSRCLYQILRNLKCKSI